MVFVPEALSIMHRLFFVLLSFMPMMSFAEAFDISQCDVIGHQRGMITMKDCITVASCNETFAGFPQDLEVCIRNAKTQEQCKAYIKMQNQKIEEKNLVYRCPMTADLLKYKSKPKTHFTPELVYDNGNAIDQEILGGDRRYAYLFHGTYGLTGIINRQKYGIIGLPEDQGLNMVLIEDEK